MKIEALERRLMSPEIDLRALSAEQQFQVLMSKVADAPDAVVSPARLSELLKRSKATGTPLRVKFGIDPTGPDIHVGHAVSLLNLRRFQRMGHQVLLVIGDFTGMVGDPSGRASARPALTESDIHRNMQTYEEQASRIIDLKDPTIERHYNSHWMKTLSMKAWIDVIKKVSVNSLLQREDFRNRIASGQGLSLAELEYSLYMGYDSVVLKPDVELGGMDQYLNLHMCRQMMEQAGQQPEVVLTYNLLSGTTGQRDAAGRLVKMSKSNDNYIRITAPPADMYGKIMSIPDEVMWVYYRELTEASAAEVAELQMAVASGEVHPKLAKQLLARALVAAFNGFDTAAVEAAERSFNEKFGSEAVLVPEDTPTIRVDVNQTLLAILVEITGRSRTDVRRLVDQSGVRVLRDGLYEPLQPADLLLGSSTLIGAVVRIGKRSYYRIAG